MNEDFFDSDKHDFDERLRWQLRALRSDVPPQRDLWPGIAARLDAPRASVPHRRRVLVPLAIAASMLLAFGIGWQLRPVAQAPAPAGMSLVQQEAEAMTREYAAALRRVQAFAPDTGNNDPALHELDRSASLIRDALQRDPDASFLLKRLRHTYEKRLALTQRTLLG